MLSSLINTEALTALLADDNRFGFIVMDGNGALFGTLQVCWMLLVRGKT